MPFGPVTDHQPVGLEVEVLADQTIRAYHVDARGSDRERVFTQRRRGCLRFRRPVARSGIR